MRTLKFQYSAIVFVLFIKIFLRFKLLKAVETISKVFPFDILDRYENSADVKKGDIIFWIVILNFS